MTASGAAHAALSSTLTAAFAGPVAYGAGSSVQVEVFRDEGRFIELPTGASIVIPKGDARPTDSEFGAGQPVYEITLSVPIEIHCESLEQTDVDLVRDAIAGVIVAAIQSNETLNDTAADVEIVEMTTDEAGQEGTANLASAIISVIATIYSTSPL